MKCVLWPQWTILKIRRNDFEKSTGQRRDQWNTLNWNKWKCGKKQGRFIVWHLWRLETQNQSRLATVKVNRLAPSEPQKEKSSPCVFQPPEATTSLGSRPSSVTPASGFPPHPSWFSFWEGPCDCVEGRPAYSGIHPDLQVFNPTSKVPFTL